MSRPPTSILDLTKQRCLEKIIPQKSFHKVYETKLAGQGLIHGSHFACEYQEHSAKQHGIVVHLKPEHNSLRRLGDLVQIENVAVGDVAIIPTNVNHWQRIETEESEGIILTIEPQIIARIAREMIHSEQIELLPTFAQADPLIYQLALSIKTDLDSSNCNRLYIESLFQALSMHLLKNYSTSKFTLKENKDGLPAYKLKQAIDYINDNLKQQIKLKDIAKLLGISQYYFCHLFRNSTGVSPYKYVIQKRVNKAKNLIENSKLSLADIAYECGFSSQSQMTQHFRKCVGVTPKVYRDKL